MIVRHSVHNCTVLRQVDKRLAHNTYARNLMLDKRALARIAAAPAHSSTAEHAVGK